MNPTLRGFQILPTDQPLIARLSRGHREILAATGTYDEIAAALKIAPGTVRSRLNRARSALMKLRAQAAGQSTGAAQ